MKKQAMRWMLVALVASLMMACAGQAALAEEYDVLLGSAPKAAAQSAEAKAALTGIKMTKSTAKVALAQSRDTTANLMNYVKPVPSNAQLPELTWTSSHPSIISVNEQGVITFLDEGKARITATAPNGKRAAMVITVVTVRVKEVKSSGTITLGVGEQATVKTSVVPANATYPNYQFSSADSSIATVDDKGVVTALASGTTRITVTADAMGHEKTATTVVQVRSGEGVSLTVSAVGDITLGGDTERGTYQMFKKYLDKYQKETGDRYGAMLSKAAVYFKQDDLTIANLEGALTNSGNRPVKGKYHYKGDTAFAQILPASSIEVVNLANNHTRGYEGSGYSSTKSALNKVGVVWTGFGYSESKIIEVNGLRVGLVGFQTGSYGATASTIKSACQKLKARCDVLIASMHFCDTPEYDQTVRSTMKTYARTAVTYGADLVVGHHPHVISGMESYKGKNIVYGLGTFLSAGPNPIRPRRTFIFQETFVVQPGFVEVRDAKVIPFWVTSSDKTNDRMPMPAPAGEADKIVATIEKYSVGQKVDYEVVK